MVLCTVDTTALAKLHCSQFSFLWVPIIHAVSHSGVHLEVSPGVDVLLLFLETGGSGAVCGNEFIARTTKRRVFTMSRVAWVHCG